MAYKTPGVYVEEISLLPPSVAEVETAIPAFIGYTEKATHKGEDLTNKPTKISSLLDFELSFGGGHTVDAVTVKLNGDLAVTDLTIAKRFFMYESLRLFFDNGGGDCYIVSVGNYGATIGYDALRAGLDAVEKYDEPTILLYPDAVLLTTPAQLYTLQQNTLSQCARLMDRVAVMDLTDTGAGLDTSVQNFRDAIGINNLKYGAAYTPWLMTTYPRTLDYSVFSGTVTDAGDNAVELATITSDDELNALVTNTVTTLADQTYVAGQVTTLRTTSPTLRDRYATLANALNAAADEAAADTAFTALIEFVRTVAMDLPDWVGSITGANLKLDLAAYAADERDPAVTALVAIEKNPDVFALTTFANAAAVTAAYGDYGGIKDTPASAEDFSDAKTAGKALEAVFTGLNSFITAIGASAETHRQMAQDNLYQKHAVIGNIAENIMRELAKVPPSGAVAGRYAYVDDSRGVWKAPANVSLSAVLKPTEAISFFDQEDLNVDVNAGKSVNAIREFSGKGTMIWGARTLAGNDNEWRYVPVRRFFNMVEESVKKSTSWAVFEPNAAPLWTKVKGMIENYLIQKWRDGALAGATPDDAFYVHIGLGETMTSQDILEGRLIVRIGMAAVRPAEFIVLEFMHKLQE